jgi:zinc transport system substrate-binding protein
MSMIPLMSAKKRRLSLSSLMVFIGVLLILTACGGGEPPAVPYDAPPADAAVNVAVSVLPQGYFVEQIGGEHVSVLVMVEPGHDPISYEPKPGQLEALQERVAYFSTDVPFEDDWLDDIAAANPSMQMVDGTQGIALVDGDPHIWLSPTLVKIQAQTIYDTLIELDPDHQSDYQANLDAFLAEVEALDNYIAETLKTVKGKKIIVTHPAWSYFADDYGLEMIPMSPDGREPDAARIDELAAFAEAEGIKVVFVQAEFDTAPGLELALKIDGRTIPLSPLNPAWENNLRSVALMFAGVL